MADGVPTSRELQALKVLWRRGRATVREIYGELEPRDGELAAQRIYWDHATVLRQTGLLKE